MKRTKLCFMIFSIITVFAIIFPGCSDEQRFLSEEEQLTSASDQESSFGSDKENSTGSQSHETEYTLTIGEKVYKVQYEPNESARLFKKLFPLEASFRRMKDVSLMYADINDTLPNELIEYEKVAAGDILLDGDNRIVLIYEDSQPVQLYTKIGHIEDAQGLSELVSGKPLNCIFDKT